MFEIEKTFRFEAGHMLEHHDGRCRNRHGHSYVLTIKIVSDQLIPSGPKRNMVVDFDDISKVVKPMIDQYLDHQWLNESLDSDSTTVEFIAQWIYRYLKPLLPQLTAVTLWETATARATYSE
jgi:6-pyruvoyltetrahydropterin/6-carboxytetrahydropterin synthase